MSTIQPGDRVQCIEQDTFLEWSVDVGSVYVCEEVWEWPPGRNPGCTVHGTDCQSFGIRLVGKEIPQLWYWCGKCFAPINGDKIDWKLFAESKRPVDGPRLTDLPKPPGVQAPERVVSPVTSAGE